MRNSMFARKLSSFRSRVGWDRLARVIQGVKFKEGLQVEAQRIAA